MSSGEILYRFLVFYGFYFDSQNEAIDISQMMSSNKNEGFFYARPYVSKNALRQKIDLVYDDQVFLKFLKLDENETKNQKKAKMLGDYVRDSFTNKTSKYMYFLVDPLNLTYNPGKNIVFDKGEELYPQRFKDAVE